jgi:hypothetical protein
MSASMVFCLSACTWFGSASNSTSLTLPDLPAALTAGGDAVAGYDVHGETPFKSGVRRGHARSMLPCSRSA